MIIKASANITLTRVDDGDDGKGIKSIVNKYLASSSGSNVTTATSGWSDTIQTITTSKRYLWNYEVIRYTDNSTTTTTPVIIGVYGDTGNGISSITEYYLASPNNSGITTSTSGWDTTIPTMTATNKYLWNYEVIKYTNSTTSTGTPKIIGVYGDKGDKGETGVGISSVDVEYYLSTSSTAQSGGSWSTTAPTWVDGKYMWTRTKTVTTAGKTSYSNPVCITGGKGNTGKGVSSITEEYYLSTSKTTQTGGSWVTTPPTWVKGTYLWTRSKIVYNNPTSTVDTTPVCDSSWEAVKDVEVRVTTAEQKILPASIVATVKDSREADGTATFAQTSQVLQTATDVTYNFMSTSGGYNIVKNGGFKNSSSGWNETGHNPNGTSRSSSIWNDSNEWVLDGTYALCMRSTNNTSGEFRVDSQKFKVKRNTTYTLSYLVSGHRVTKIGHYIRGNEWNIIDSRGYWPAGGGKNRDNWTRVVNTFNTGDNYQISINFIHFVTGSDAYSWITDVIINEGGVALPWTPHPSEIYEGSTVIDASGVTVKNGAIKVENNAGTTVLQGNTSGTLYLKDGGIVVAGTATDVWNNYGYRNTLKKNGIQFNWDASDSGSGSPPVSANVYLDYSRGQLVLSGGTKAPGIYIASGLEASSITTPGSVTAAAESRFSNDGTYSDPWNGTACAIKASGHIATTGDLRANGTINANGGINITSGNLTFAQSNAEQRIAFDDCSSNSSNVYLYKGSSSSSTVLGLYDQGTASAVWRYVNDSTFVIERQLSVKGHVVPYNTRSYWLGSNGPDKQWKGVCCEGGTLGASDIRAKENITRLDGTIVTYDDYTDEIREIQLLGLENSRANSGEYYEFIKDRFKPAYYNYKLSDNIVEETGEYSIDPEDEYAMLKNVGFIAQDYNLDNDLVAREFIIKNKDGMLNYNHMSYVTVGLIALKEAILKIEELNTRVAQLEALSQ